MSRRSVSPALVLIAALAMAGCGAQDKPKPKAAPKLSDEAQVRQVVARFADATLHKDYTAICRQLLAPQLVRNVEQYGRPCEAVWKANLAGVVAPRLKIESVRVIGLAASAEVTSQAIGQQPAVVRLGFIRDRAGWRISTQS